MRFFAAALFFFGVAASFGQTPEVPHKMSFAGMTLTIRDDAKREIQKDVDALTQHPRYFEVKVERAKTYFPIIEKIFEEERVPDDFKYLSLQESALVSDAVSVSNAVGFWQFKDFTALEMGMRIDKQVDERMNLISATRGAAKYLKKNNFQFNNWIYALQSYQMGAGGVSRSVGDLQNGARHMEITSDTYWYVKKFLAHKVAFENALGGNAKLKVIPYPTQSGKSLQEIAMEFSTEEATLKEYNKWLKGESIPIDKSYTVLIPAGKLDADFNTLVLASSKASKAEPFIKKEENIEKIVINGIVGIRARKGETVADLSSRAKVSLTEFMKFNDVDIDHVIESGEVYLLGKKKPKAEENFHKVKLGETLWSISQQHGVRIKKLKNYNRLASDTTLVTGSTLWLNAKRPDDQEGEIAPETDVAEIESDETFDWYIKTPKDLDEVTIQIPPTLPIESVLITSNVKEDTMMLHTVQQGETLYAIAKAHNVNVMDLVSWNDLSVQDNLKPGQVLRITPMEKKFQIETNNNGVDSVRLHEVQTSDTLYSVARQYEVTIKEIMDWNNKKDFSLTVGEKLRILQK
jgi:membrane-bound lytic murein transglycosylase D